MFSYALSAPSLSLPPPLTVTVLPLQLLCSSMLGVYAALLNKRLLTQKSNGWDGVQMTLPLLHASLAGWPPSTCAYQWGMQQATSWGVS